MKLEGYGLPDRKDRFNNTGYGGVLAWVKSDINSKRRKELEVDDMEILWIELKLFDVKLLLGVCYRPPNSAVEWWTKFENILYEVRDHCPGHLVLTGDMNRNPMTSYLTKLQNLSKMFNNKIHVDEPTHINGSILDQLFTNCDKFKNKIEVSDPVSTNDHFTLCLWLNF